MERSGVSKAGSYATRILSITDIMQISPLPFRRRGEFLPSSPPTRFCHCLTPSPYNVTPTIAHPPRPGRLHPPSLKARSLLVPLAKWVGEWIIYLFTVRVNGPSERLVTYL